MARDEEKQPTTQESMFNLVRLSDGGIHGEENLISEVDFIVSLAERVFENSPIDWSVYRDHKEIQKIISKSSIKKSPEKIMGKYFWSFIFFHFI